jgi:hypothetical protein
MKNLNTNDIVKTATTSTKLVTKKVTKKTKPQAKAVTTFKTVHTIEDYKTLSKSRGAFRGYTVASLLLLGLIKLTGKGATKGKQARRADLKTLVGNTACSHWIASERITANDKGAITITAKGITAINESLAGQAKGGYNTTVDTVKAISALFDKGGKLTNPNGLSIDMRTEASVSV